MIAAAPFPFAAVATLSAQHLRLLSGVDEMALRLEAGMPVEEAAAELRAIAESARAAA